MVVHVTAFFPILSNLTNQLVCRLDNINTLNKITCVLVLLFCCNCQYPYPRTLKNCSPSYAGLNSHPWLQQCYLDLCGTLNDTLDPAFNQECQTLRMTELLQFALNYNALKFNGNEVNWAVELCCGAEQGGAMMLSCQEHRTVGTYSGCWVKGLGEEGLYKTFVWVELPFFLPADSLCKPEATEWKSGSTLTSHHLIPDFWSVAHILINSCILREYTCSLKWAWRQQYLSSPNCYKLPEYDRPKLNFWM